MKRRDFVTLLGGAVAWPLMAHAQETGRLRRVAVVKVNLENDPASQGHIVAIRDGLRELGWVEGRNIRIDYYWGAGEPERARAYATELATNNPDVILAHGTPVVAALQRATRSVPIVFVVVTDPVGAGFVQSMAHPGGNITGFSTFEPEIGGKWLQSLKEISPGLRRVAGIRDPAFKGFDGVWGTIESLAAQMGIEAISLVFHGAGDDIESSVAKFAETPGGGLIALPTALNNMARSRIFALAAQHRLPAVYPFREYATSGGLMAYGFDPTDLFRRSAVYIDRVLRGEKPGDLPVQAPTKFELIINLKTANAQGFTMPPALLARADEVIE
jgi:putative ABC transport system substrate-binding protein